MNELRGFGFSPAMAALGRPCPRPAGDAEKPPAMVENWRAAFERRAAGRREAAAAAVLDDERVPVAA